MENTDISIDAIRIQTMMFAIHKQQLTNAQLSKLTRYLFSEEFVKEFIDLDTSAITDKQKKIEFDKIYLRSISPIELLN